MITEERLREIALEAAEKFSQWQELPVAHDLAEYVLEYLREAVAEERAWQPIETAPAGQEVLIAYWRWRNSMLPGSIIVQSARRTELHGPGIWSWVVSDNKHGPFPIRRYSAGDILGWRPLPLPPPPGEPA